MIIKNRKKKTIKNKENKKGACQNETSKVLLKSGFYQPKDEIQKLRLF